MSSGAASRTAVVERVTNESRVSVELDLDGTGRSQISTGVPFYDHMLTALSTHSLVDLTVTASGDVEIDAHHTVEDVAICIGQALGDALGDKAGISRYGDALVPLDEALAQAVVDISGRPYFVHTGEPDGMAYVLIGGGGAPPPDARALTPPAVGNNPPPAGLTIHPPPPRGGAPHPPTGAPL